MILLTGTTDFVELVTAAAQSTDYVTSFVDITTTTFTPGSSQGNISAATTTTLVAAPAASTQRQVKYITIVNRGAGNQTVTAAKSSAATVYNFTNAIVLAQGESLVYTDVGGWQKFDAFGRLESAIGSSANPTALVKLTATNGTASTFMTSDSAPALDVTIAPTWTGAHTFSALVTANLGLTVLSPALVTGVNEILRLTSTAASGSAYLTFFGPTIRKGYFGYPSGGSDDFAIANEANAALRIYTNSAVVMTLSATGNVTINAPTSGITLTVNGVAGGLPLDILGITNSTYLRMQRSGAAVLYLGSADSIVGGGATTDAGFVSVGGFVLGTNGSVNRLSIATAGNVTINAPTSGVALTVNGLTGGDTAVLSSTGAAASFTVGWNAHFSGVAWNIFTASTDNMAIGTLGAAEVGIATNSIKRVTVAAAGNITIVAPTSGTALTVNGLSSNWTMTVNGGVTAGQSYGLLVQAGVNSGDAAIAVYNQAGTVNFLVIHGDGNGSMGPSATNHMSWNAAGSFSIAVSVNGDTLTVAPSVASGALIATSAALTTGAGAALGTLSNAPSAGNPTKWIKINDNGTIRSVPAW